MGDKITIIRGDDVVINLELVDDDGTAVDLTDTVLRFSVKRRFEDADVILTKEITVHEEPENGISNIVLSDQETDLEPGSYFWDLEIEADGLTSSTDYGIFKVKPDITKSELAS